MSKTIPALTETIETFNIGDDFNLYINRLNHLLSLK